MLTYQSFDANVRFPIIEWKIHPAKHRYEVVAHYLIKQSSLIKIRVSELLDVQRERASCFAHDARTNDKTLERLDSVPAAEREAL